MAATGSEAQKNVGQYNSYQYSWMDTFPCICTRIKLAFLEWKYRNECFKQCDELEKCNIAINIMF